MKKVGLLVLVFALFTLSAWADSTTLFYQNWNGLTAGTYTSSSGTIGGFNVTSGSIDVIDNTWYGYLCSGAGMGSTCVDTGGFMIGSMTTATTFTLLPGSNYTLSFELAGSQRGYDTNEIVSLVTSGGTFWSQSYSLPSNQGATLYSYNFSVSSPTTVSLSFVNPGTPGTPGYDGTLLGPVSLTDPVPEPSSLVLMGTGLLGAAGALRRRFLK